MSDLYQSLAQGKEDILRLRDLFLQIEAPVPATSPAPEHTARTDESDKPRNTMPNGVAIVVDMNVKNVDYNLSKCCNPQPGEPIFGFISITKGVRIHRCDCPNAASMRERYPYRMIPARWATTK